MRNKAIITFFIVYLLGIFVITYQEYKKVEGNPLKHKQVQIEVQEKMDWNNY